jgi:hypothetical protein
LRIETYFEGIQKVVKACPALRLSNIALDKRGTCEGYIKGELSFADGATLHFREFIDVENDPERLMYVYQFQNANTKLIFRYDNTGHHKKKNLPTYPDHKHQGSEENVIASDAPTLAEVLEEIMLS